MERARSDYFYARKWDRDDRSLEEAIEEEADRTAADWDRVRQNGGCPFFFQHQSYLYKGRYAEQLDRYASVFDEEQLLVLKSETLFSEPQSVVDRVCQFLSVSPHPLDEEGTSNAGTYAGDDDAVTCRLRDYYEEPNRRLREQHGIQFG